MSEPHGWIGYTADKHGRPLDDGNEHLTDEQRAELTRRAEERAAARGVHQARVIIDVYESGEAVPQVQFPAGSTVDMSDRAAVAAVVRAARDALDTWR